MAGFFGLFDFTKPGPGVEKDAPPKPRPIVFFQVVGRKFWHLVRINIMYTFFNIPAYFAMIYATGSIVRTSNPEDPFTEFYLRFVFGAILVCIPVITIGPVTAGITYILRNFSREEHAFLWWDFRDSAKNNFRQSLIICVIDFVAVIMFGYAVNFYYALGEGGMLSYLAGGFSIIAFLIFILMHLYIYPMLVTFKLTLRQLYKNAFLFAIAKLLPNIGILLLCSAILIITFLYPFIGAFLFLFITQSFLGLLTNFYVYPILKKYIIDKLDDEKKEPSAGS